MKQIDYVKPLKDNVGSLKMRMMINKLFRKIGIIIILAIVINVNSSIFAQQTVDPIERIYTLMRIDSIQASQGNMSDFSELLRSEKEIKTLYEVIGDTISSEYFTAFHRVCVFLYYTHEDEECIKQSKVYLDALCNYYPKACNNMEEILRIVIAIHVNNALWDEAIKANMELMELYNFAGVKDENKETELLLNIASNYLNWDKIDKAEEYYKLAKALITEQEIKDESILSYCNHINAELLCKTSRFTEALPIFFELLDSHIYSKNEASICSILDRITRCYYSLGLFDKAKEYGTRVVNYCEEKMPNSFLHAQALLELGLIYERRDGDEWTLITKSIEASNDFRKDLEYSFNLKQKACEIYFNLYGENNKEYLFALQSLYYTYGLLSEDDNEITLNNEHILGIIERNNDLYGTQSHFYTLGSAIENCLYNKNYTYGASLADKLISLVSEFKGNPLIPTPYALYNTCGRAYMMNDEIDKAMMAFSEEVEVRRNYLENNVFNINEYNTRNSFWDMHINSMLEVFNFYEKYENNYSGLLYNILLLYKNAKLTLGSTRKTKDEFFKIKWQDLETNLEDDEILIEFCRVEASENEKKYLTLNEPYYIALTLRKDDESPQSTYLCTENELLWVTEKRRYTSDKLYQLVWEPLKDRFEGITDIIFSPMGELNNIAIEYLKFKNTTGEYQNISELFDFHRVSSTREILNNNGNENNHWAALFGGMLYSSNYENLNNNDFRGGETLTRGLLSEFQNRSGFKDLIPATVNEINDISSALKNAGYNIKIYSGVDGTEGAFKMLSSENPSILHIATHGFYFNEHTPYTQKISFNMQEEYVEDESMLRSGIIFSGANKVIEGELVPEDMEDGILTAQEISYLDLSQVDLLVLSACQTGLGEIKGEGVYGLQRGFKKAGVKSIMMSLWEVDDDATELLMTEFYRNYVNGMTKMDALLNAQRKVRDTPGFSDPEFWAAFILLDALN